MSDHAILHALPEATLVLAGDRIEAANAAAGAVFQRPCADLIGLPLASLVSEPPERVRALLLLWSGSGRFLPGSLTASARNPGEPGTRYTCAGARLIDPARADTRLIVRFTPTETASRRFRLLNEQLTTLGREARVAAEQQAWLEAVLNLMPTPMLLIDPPSGRVIFANRAAEDLQAPRGSLPIARAAAGERLQGVEMELPLQGEPRTILAHSDLLPPMHGQAAAAVLMFQDVTRLKQAERQLQHAVRLKDEFLATLSHELRTPLNAIMGWTMMLQNGMLDEAGRARALDSIERNARAQSRLVEDLLDVSRIITGRLRLDLKPTSVVPAIEAALDAIRPSAEAKGVELTADLDPAADTILADPGRLQQVVWNLLSNAVKFTPPGGAVRVSLACRADGVEIAVSDTGVGIDREFLPRVFERFSQADPGITRTHAGLGLGLAIVRHLVELHGGTVEAFSAGAGHGSTFIVRLPAVGEESVTFRAVP